MKLFDRRPKIASCSKPDDKEHFFAVADLMAYMCGKSRQYGAAVSVASGKDRYRFISFLMLDAFFDGDSLRLADGEDFLTETERFFFSRLLRILIDGNRESELIDFARCYLASLESSGQLSLSLVIGAEAIVSMKTLELSNSVGPYTYMAYYLGGMMGHPFVEKYIQDFKNGTWFGSDDYCKHVNARFPKTELLRKERLIRLEKFRREKALLVLFGAEHKGHDDIAPVSVQDEKTGTTLFFTDLARLGNAETQLLLKHLFLKDLGLWDINGSMYPQSARSVCAKFFQNLPVRVAEDFHGTGSNGNDWYAEETQKKILEIALTLIHEEKILSPSAKDELIRYYEADEEAEKTDEPLFFDEELPCDIDEVGVNFDDESCKFCFTDFADMEDRSIQKILREVSQYGLALALMPKSAVKVREKIFSNMSVRAAEMLLDDIRSLDMARKADVMDSQQRLLSLACRLRNAKEILFPGETWYFGENYIKQISVTDEKSGKTLCFADLVELSDEDMQKVLSSIDMQKLLVSLFPKNAQTVYEKVMNCLPKKTASLLREDIEFINSVGKAEVEAAQKHVLSEVMHILGQP